METLVVILVVLFLALFILVPLLEKMAAKGKGVAGPSPKLMKWIFPMMALVIVLQLFRHYFG